METILLWSILASLTLLGLLEAYDYVKSIGDRYKNGNKNRTIDVQFHERYRRDR